MKLFCAIMTSSSFSEVGEKKWRTEKKYGELLRPALQYVNEHFKENIGIEHLAKVCNFNPKYFCKIFKQYTSQTVMDYINSYRLHKAELPIISEPEIREGWGFTFPALRKWTYMSLKWRFLQSEWCCGYDILVSGFCS